MPTYQYKCLKCGHDFELFQKMNDEPVKECPECKGDVKRLLGAGAGTIFKGSGFYHTDYKNAKTDSKSESKTETKSESKPAKPKPSDSKEK